ncbi:MAG: hypothetical protein GY839_21830 [candidate division Zixibacteria bacterium]|nr:hypothetical protein [candidate division Zixibacteria bacterium]
MIAMLISSEDWTLLLAGIMAATAIVSLILEISKKGGKTITKALVIITFISILAVSFLVLYNAVNVKEQYRDRIALLLPLSSEDENVREDAKHQFLGLMDFLHKEDFDVDVVVRSHKLETSKISEIVKQEMRDGTLYFITTMSSVAEPLAKQWDILCQENSEKGECYLIASVASAPGISKHSKNVYRFYVRSEEEGRLLAGTAVAEWKDILSAITICVDDHYGDGAAEKFKDFWEDTRRTVTKQVKLSSLKNTKENRLKKLTNLKFMSEEDRQCIFIANYGGGMAETIQGLKDIYPRPKLLTTSTFSIDSWRNKIPSEYLEEFDWITVQPRYKANKENYLDVVRDFTYFTLLRVAYVIMKQKENGHDFNTQWLLAHAMPADLRFELTEEGDAEIKLDIYKH